MGAGQGWEHSFQNKTPGDETAATAELGRPGTPGSRCPQRPWTEAPAQLQSGGHCSVARLAPERILHPPFFFIPALFRVWGLTYDC